MNNWTDIIIICAILTIISLIFLYIHLSLDKKEKSGKKLSKSEKRWKDASIIAFCIFIVPLFVLLIFLLMRLWFIFCLLIALLSIAIKGK